MNSYRKTMPGNDNSDAGCGYCGKVYNPYLGDRFWTGRGYTVPDDQGGTKTVELLCDDCHRRFVREA